MTKNEMAQLVFSKKQYATLVRQIEAALRRFHKAGMKGGGPYDFSAPEMFDAHPLGAVPFYVVDPALEGGGFWSSMGKAARHVWGALKKSGVIEKGKDLALKTGRELGGKAIEAATHKLDDVAKSRGVNISGVTRAAAERAHEALHDAEGHAATALDKVETAVDKRIGGQGLRLTGSGINLAGTGFALMPSRTPGIPKNAMLVSQSHHLAAHPQVAAGGY